MGAFLFLKWGCGAAARVHHDIRQLSSSCAREKGGPRRRSLLSRQVGRAASLRPKRPVRSSRRGRAARVKCRVIIASSAPLMRMVFIFTRCRPAHPDAHRAGTCPQSPPPLPCLSPQGPRAGAGFFPASPICHRAPDTPGDGVKTQCLHGISAFRPRQQGSGFFAAVIVLS